MDTAALLKLLIKRKVFRDRRFTGTSGKHLHGYFDIKRAEGVQDTLNSMVDKL